MESRQCVPPRRNPSYVCVPLVRDVERWSNPRCNPSPLGQSEKRQCLERSCNAVLPISAMVNGRCRPCHLARERIRRVNRPLVDKVYSTAAWQRLRAEVLAEEHRCAWCGAVDVKLTAGHVIPLRQRSDLALDRANVHASCRSCQNTHQNRRPAS